MTSALKSPLVLKNTSKGQVELLDYKHRLNTGVCTVLPIKLTNNGNVAPATTNLSGVSEQFQINRAGKLTMLYVKTYFSLISAAGAHTGLDLSGFGKKLANIQVNTSGDLVYNQPADAFGALFARLTPSQKTQVNYMTQVFDSTGHPVPLTGANNSLSSYYTYTPVLGPFWQNERMNWDLQSLEQLTLNVTYPFTNAQLGLGSGVALYQTAGKKAEAFAVYRDYEVDYKKDLYLSNFGTDGKDRSYLGYTLESRRFDLTSTTSTSFKVPFKTPCANFNVAIVSLVEAGALVAARPINKKILTFKMVLDSQTYIENVDPQVLDAIGGMFNGINTEMVCVAAGQCTERAQKDETSLNVVLASRPNDMTSFSGALAYATIEDPQITIIYDSVTAANYKIVYSQLIYAESLMNGVTGAFSLTKSA